MSKKLLCIGANVLVSQELVMSKTIDVSRATARSGADSRTDNNGAPRCVCAPAGAELAAPKYSAELMRMLSQLVVLR